MNDLKKIKIFKLKRFKNPKGDVLRGFRKTDKCPGISAEIYFSWINKKAIKGWKLHKKMSMNLIVPIGEVKFVFYDGKEFKKIIIGEKNYNRIFVPSNIFFAFQNLSTKKSLIVNNASIIHQNKKEMLSLSLSKIRYLWKD
tara:strand:- start:88 stop:510 length:423 start_codon:yes stop_codon:yes gene_type:complete